MGEKETDKENETEGEKEMLNIINYTKNILVDDISDTIKFVK